MAQVPRHLTQSKFFSAAFNSAIFDGPFRLYFAQHQEPLALKVYFRLQQALGDLYEDAKTRHRESGHNLFIMLYPSSDDFEASFDGSDQRSILVEAFDADKVIGVRGPLEEQAYEEVYLELRRIIESWRRRATPSSPSRQHLELL